MRRRLAVLLAAVVLGTSVLAIAGVPAVLAGCESTKVILDRDDPSQGATGTFCVSLPNFTTIAGPCWNFGANNWNDCVSQFTLTLSQTMCFKYYKNINYGGLMGTIWGPQTNNVWHATSVSNDIMSSVKFYPKTPETPAGNC
jgi:hypothetical protein